MKQHLIFNLFIIVPFKIKSWSSPRKSFFLVLIVLALSVASAAPTLWTYGVFPNLSYRTGKGCLAGIDNFTTAWINVFVVTLGSMVYPVVLLTILTLLLILKLAKISSERKALTKSQDRDNKKEIQATITMVFLGAVQCALYIPSGTFAGLFYAYSILKFLNYQTSINLAYILAAMARSTLSLTVFCHLYNLYLYLIRIHAFRSDLKSFIPCKSLVHPNGSSEKGSGSASLSTH